MTPHDRLPTQNRHSDTSVFDPDDILTNLPKRLYVYEYGKIKKKLMHFGQSGLFTCG